MLSHRRASGAARWRSRRSSAVVALLLFLTASSPTLTVRAATTPPAIVDPGDPRSEGEGAGLVGDPLLAAMGVVALGLLASGATLVYLRLSRHR